MHQLLDVPAPAKLNLFLHVVGQRADGYHLLQSVFMLIDWADTLHFERHAGGQITREDLGNHPPLPTHDLVVRAAQALQVATGCSWGAHIGLHKRIPVEAGLGGGSSDAATTLLALNRLWDLHLPLPALLAIGQTLGADVPFFLGGRNAWVEGIGEQLRPIELPKAGFWVVKPAAGASTPQIFQHPALKRDTQRVIMEDFVANELGAVYTYGHNDLQPVASELCPDIALGLHWFATQGLQARMTGSGSALFAQADSAVNTTALPPGWQARYCNNLMEHPLIGWR
jgi:4-diphosphocytidyl-2-C-methyl-D-erythritol kinase